MEKLATIHVERLPEGVYLATSEEIQGLVAQGRTLWETLEIARDVARKLIEAKKQRNVVKELKPITRKFDFPLVLECYST
jgi:predicted RNase H-like HicB family nuclease